VARDLLNREGWTLQVVAEGSESDDFWTALGAAGGVPTRKYDTDADFMQYTRLFRCTNEKGYFSVSEKTVDFCQVFIFIL
jgi:hypothetical protein